MSLEVTEGVGRSLQYKGLFHTITHCYKEANNPVGRLAKRGVDLRGDSVFESFATLPTLVHGDVHLDRLGFPNLHQRSH